MKKIICIVLCMVFVFSLTACGKESAQKPSHSVDVAYYATLGQINNVEYKIGDNVDDTIASLQKAVDDHGDTNYFDYPSGDYTIMSDGAVYCCYKTDDKESGLTHVVTTGDAYGFAIGAVSVEVRDTMNAIFGDTVNEREATRDEIFFLPAGANMTVLKYEFYNSQTDSAYAVLFVFQEHSLSATVISKSLKPKN